MNHHNVEQDEHEAVVELVVESGDMVTLNVQSIKQETAGAGTRELTVEVVKENNTFGFSINQDAQGFFIQMLAPEGPAESAGVSVGDRVTGIDDREDFECELTRAHLNESLNFIAQTWSTMALSTSSKAPSQFVCPF